MTELLKELHRIVNEAIRTQAVGEDQAEGMTFDLSKIDLERLREEFARKVARKATAIQDIRDVVENKLADMRKGNVGFIFQSFNLIDDLNVAENVEVSLLYRHIGSSDRRKRVAAALERVGIAHRAKHLPHQLSGGQQQRVAIARALVAEVDRYGVASWDPELTADALRAAFAILSRNDQNEAETAALLARIAPLDVAIAVRLIT